MGTNAWFGYRYHRQYYRKLLPRGAGPSEFGLRLINSIPRDSVALQAWIDDKIKMLGKVKTVSEADLCPDGCFDETDWGYELSEDVDWTFSHKTDWTYIVDLDNRVLTLTGRYHFRLDNMPPSDSNLEWYAYWRPEYRLPTQYIKHPSEMDLWLARRFNVEERQQAYESLAPTIVPVKQWGYLTWAKLSRSQRFSVVRANHLLRYPASLTWLAYAPRYRYVIGPFCWDLLCAATPGVPLIHYDAYPRDKFVTSREHGNIPSTMVNNTGNEVFKSFDGGDRADYCWVRGCLITFCAQLGQQAYVAHEVEQMVRKMDHDGHTECTGIILSSRGEMIVVDIDDGLPPMPRVRHTPVLNLHPIPDRSGQASHGLLLLVHLLSPLLTVLPLPWRTSRLDQSARIWSRAVLPVEVLQHIIHFSDTSTYLTLCQVSRSIRSICLANPRVGEYTILYKIPGWRRDYVARCAGDSTRRRIRVAWKPCPPKHVAGFWEAAEIVGPEEAEETVAIVSADRQASDSNSD